ncbi:hypothetical protein OC846_002311 [Tilletia horrida]|uniref:Uncharacterized protein n=1 Tax=Tilletia horrida TaxID=155126 RepID=A0AAN6GUC3_9BASI|nr:hypothetical protein OC846_002311 [Tilletia horrida]KAK0567466.1 hypothetical protein OC861_002689 [Tilletia horrida]
MSLVYLSFQRPPPHALVPNEALRVCVNVTNDLRSEPYLPPAGAPLRLRLVWVDEKFKPIGGAPTAEHTWTDASSAYKVVDGLKAPSSLRGIDIIHLAICGVPPERRKNAAGPSVTPVRRGRIPITPAQHQNTGVEDGYVFRLHADERSEGPEFVPVLSGPIRVSRHSSDLGKQNVLLRIIRLGDRTLPIPSKCVDVVIQEHTGFDLDKHIWDASIHLLRLLTSPATSLPASLRLLERAREQMQVSNQPFRIVELGAGTGIVSIVLAKWLASQINLEPEGQATSHGAVGANADSDDAIKPPLVSFYATDLESALPIMNTNLDLNGCTPSNTSAQSYRHVGSDRVRFHAPVHLNWTDSALPGELSQQTDLVLISDCTYNSTFYKPLAQTLTRLSPRSCILAKKHRHEDEKVLWNIFGEEEQRDEHGTFQWVLVKGHSQDDSASSGDCDWAVWERRTVFK